jgi:hypothetical protein
MQQAELQTVFTSKFGSNQALARIILAEERHLSNAAEILSDSRTRDSYAQPSVYLDLQILSHLLPALTSVQATPSLYENCLAMRDHYYLGQPIPYIIPNDVRKLLIMVEDGVTRAHTAVRGMLVTLQVGG